MGIRLVIDKGPLSGTVLILENGTSWSLGSDGKASDILLQDEKLAPSQIRITLKDGEYYLENLDALRPVSVDGTVITAPVLLKDGVSFVMGSCQVSFFKGEEVEGDIELSFQTEGGNEGEPAAQGSSSVSSEAPKKETGNPSLPSEAKASGEVSSSAIAKEQELAASFLASVEKEPGTPKEVSEPKVSSQEGQTPSVTGEKRILSFLWQVKNNLNKLLHQAVVNQPNLKTRVWKKTERRPIKISSHSFLLLQNRVLKVPKIRSNNLLKRLPHPRKLQSRQENLIALRKKTRHLQWRKLP